MHLEIKFWKVVLMFFEQPPWRDLGIQFVGQHLLIKLHYASMMQPPSHDLGIQFGHYFTCKSSCIDASLQPPCVGWLEQLEIGKKI